MNNINGFRVWDKKKKKMYYSNVSKNKFLIDCGGNLFETVQTGKDQHLDDRTIRLIPGHIAQERYIVMQLLNRTDISGRGIYEEDILRYETGNEFTVIFGTHNAFCHGDRMDTTNEGFCAATYEDGKTMINDFSCYPLSDVESLALIVGNTCEKYFENGGDEECMQS